MERHHSGNALIMILIATALFAALGIAMMEGSRNTTSMLSDEQARVYANQIMAYGNDVKSAIKRLELRGCTETQISFENSVDTGYANTNTPPDTCKIYNNNGGGLNWITFSEQAFDKTNTTKTGYGQYGFSGTTWIYGLPSNTNTSELLFWVFYLDEAVCKKLNALVGVNDGLVDPPNMDHGPHSAKFQGTYTSSYGNSVNGYTTPPGLKSGCAKQTNSSLIHGSASSVVEAYHFYMALIAR